jgi:predicted O-methyltransferase YrrM
MTKDGSGPPRSELERYAAELFVQEDPLLAELRAELEARGFPTIQVPARTGLLLSILVRACGARRVLEVGALGGYSALWMASALPAEGRLLTLEKEPEHAELAREFIERAGRAEVIEVRVGNAAELLPAIDDEGRWDLVFLDADKERYGTYLKHAERLLRPGGLVVADNVFWHGKILEDPGEADESTRALQEFNRSLAGHPSFDATILPVGDGVALGVRR